MVGTFLRFAQSNPGTTNLSDLSTGRADAFSNNKPVIDTCPVPSERSKDWFGVQNEKFKMQNDGTKLKIKRPALMLIN